MGGYEPADTEPDLQCAPLVFSKAATEKKSIVSGR